MDSGWISMVMAFTLILVSDIWWRQRKLYQKVKIIETSLNALRALEESEERALPADGECLESSTAPTGYDK